MKYLNFTVAETSGRTFELSLDKAKEIIKRLKEDAYYLSDEEVDLDDDYEVAHFLMNFGLDEITKYELSNDYVDLVLADHKVFEQG